MSTREQTRPFHLDTSVSSLLFFRVRVRMIIDYDVSALEGQFPDVLDPHGKVAITYEKKKIVVGGGAYTTKNDYDDCNHYKASTYFKSLCLRSKTLLCNNHERTLIISDFGTRRRAHQLFKEWNVFTLKKRGRGIIFASSFKWLLHTKYRILFHVPFPLAQHSFHRDSFIKSRSLA